MKRRITKYLTIAAIVLVLLIAAGGWCLDRWLQSTTARAQIEGTLSDELKMPVKIDGMGFSSWSGLSTKKITVSGPDGVLFEAEGISASHSFTSLFRGNLGLSEVRIRQPHIRLFQNAAGQWTPSRYPEPATPAPQPVPAVPAAPSAPVPVVSAPKKHPAVSVGKILIENGTVEMFDKARAPFATLTGLNVTMRDVSETAFNGNLAIDKAVLHGRLAIEHLSGLTVRDGNSFSLRDFSVGIGGGKITGEAGYTVGATATAKMKINAVNLALATLQGGMSGQTISGIVSGDAQVSGLGAERKAIAGSGTLALKGGDCSQFELLRQIGDILRVAALAHFQIADATVNFQVANEQVILSPMAVITPPITLSMSGPVTFDGVLNLSANLHAPASLVATQPLIAGQFTPPDANGLQSVPFAITGDMKKPRQNLADTLTGTKNHRQQNIIAAGSILSTILQKNNPKLLKKLEPALQFVQPNMPPAQPPAPTKP